MKAIVAVRRWFGALLHKTQPEIAVGGFTACDHQQRHERRRH